MVTTSIKKGNISRINKSLKKIEDSFNEGSFFEKLGFLINSSIQRRVQKEGKGIDLKKMEPYSTPYADFKQLKGRSTNFRDLTFSGKMWQSLSVAKINKGSKMFFTGANSKNKADGNQARTPFFGVSEREKDLIRKEIKILAKL